MGSNPFRIIRLSFWNDEKVVEQFSAEDRYFFLYLLTNPRSTQLGIYPFVRKTAAYELGYSVEAVAVLLDRFENKYGIIKYSPETSEVAIKNFLVHNIVRGGTPVFDLLVNELSRVKNTDLIVYIYNHLITLHELNDTVMKLLDYIKESNYIKEENIINNKNQRYGDESSTNRSKPFRELSREARDFFEECWKAYPKKRGKGAISDHKKIKLMNEVGLEQMMRCIERYKLDIRGRENQFIMYGSTFFNSGYVDYLDTNVESVQGETKMATSGNGRTVYIDHDGEELQ